MKKSNAESPETAPSPVFSRFFIAAGTVLLLAALALYLGSPDGLDLWFGDTLTEARDLFFNGLPLILAVILGVLLDKVVGIGLIITREDQGVGRPRVRHRLAWGFKQETDVYTWHEIGRQCECQADTIQQRFLFGGWTIFATVNRHDDGRKVTYTSADDNGEAWKITRKEVHRLNDELSQLRRRKKD